MKFPVLVLTIMYLIFNFSVSAVLLLFIIIIFEIIFYYIILVDHDQRSLAEFSLYCRKYSNYEFVKMNPKTFEENNEIDFSIKELLAGPMDIAEVYCAVLVDPKIRTRITTWTTFPLSCKQGRIVINSNLSKLNIYEQFKLYHEIAHLSYPNIRVKFVNIYFKVIMLYYLFISSLLIDDFSYVWGINLFLSVSLFLFYLYNFNSKLEGENGLLEITANAFAILYLVKHKNFAIIEELYKKKKGEMVWDESYNFYMKELKDCENDLNDNWIKTLGKFKRRLNRVDGNNENLKNFVKDKFRADFMLYTSRVERIFTSNSFVNTLLLILMSFVVYNAKPILDETLYVVAFFCIFIPTACALIQFIIICAFSNQNNQEK